MFDRARLAHLRSAGALTPGRLLDVGAGRGRFVAQARAAGWYAHGIEPSRRGIEGARAIGIELVEGTIDDADVPPGSLDAATLWHVLEHVSRSRRGARSDRRLAAAGRRCCSSACRTSPACRRFSAGRAGITSTSRAIARTSRSQGLEALLRAHGLEPVSTRHVLLEHNPFGLWVSVVSRATRVPSWLYHALKRNAPLRSRDALVTLLALPLAPVAVVLEALFGLARRGGTVSVVARKVG